MVQATIEHRKLAVDLAEVIIKWEVQRIKEEQEVTGDVSPSFNINPRKTSLILFPEVVLNNALQEELHFKWVVKNLA